jgi:hypothetical protein
MFLVDVNWHPSRKELRTFALIAFIAAAVIALLLYKFRGLGIGWTAAIFSLGIVILLCSVVSLRIIRVIYLGLIIATLPIGWLISFFLLAAFYFGIITPLAIIFRLTGRDSLHRKFDRDVESYWISHRQLDNFDRYFDQF